MFAERLFMLSFGTERIAKSVSVLGAGGQILREPIVGVLVETRDGFVLLDTGISGAALRDPQALTEIYGAGLHPDGPDDAPAGPAFEGEPLQLALASVGLTIGDLSLAAVSHLHLDHTGGIGLLAAAGVPIAIQGRELAYGRERARAGTEREVAFYRDDYLRDDVTWIELDGDERVAPGVQVLATPGHTPGHMSYRVDLPNTGTWIFAADAADLGENLIERIPCGTTAEPGDAAAAKESVNRLVDEADRLDARLVPGHDPLIWKAVWHPVEGHR